jgi:predicted transcriptional regulator
MVKVTKSNFKTRRCPCCGAQYLTEREEQVFRFALLKSESIKVNDICHELQITVAWAKIILNKLIKKGFMYRKNLYKNTYEYFIRKDVLDF